MTRSSVRGAAAVALVMALLVVLLGRPWAYGIPLSATARFWAFVLVEVALPGIALCWATGRFRGDRLLLAGQGLSLGLCLQAGACFGARALHAPWVATALPVALACAVLVVARPRRVVESPGPGAGARGLLPCLVLVLLACAIQPLLSLRSMGDPIPLDLLFHAGNAAEVRHRWPLQIPRIAGIPLKYPVLVYALPAEAAGFVGRPVADVMLCLAPLFWIALLAVQVHNAGRALFGDARVGVLGAAIVVLHADPGRLLGLGPAAFNSYLATGVYGSPTTICGFILLASIGVCLADWLGTDPVSRRQILVFGLLCVASSATKASVLPTVAGGLLLLVAWSWRQRRSTAVAAVLALAVLLVAAAPATLWLARGEGSYREMLRFSPGAAIRLSAFASWFGRATGLGSPSRPATLLAAALPWLVGYLGLAGAGLLVWMRGRRGPLPPAQAWALGVLATGAAIGLSLEAVGLSQLFFFYSGQVLLAPFAGAGILAAWHARRWRTATLLLAFALPSLHLAVTGPLLAHREDRRTRLRRFTPAEAEYAKGLAWLRDHATRDTVLLADNASLYLSAFGECRAFYESGRYSPSSNAAGGRNPDEEFRETIALQEHVLRRPDAEAIARLRARFPPGTTLRAVTDSVQTSFDGGTELVSIGPVPGRRLLPAQHFDLEFTDGAMHVYRLSGDEPARHGDLPSNRATP